MKYCKKCLQTDTRPGITFDENGVCSACNYRINEYQKIDWKERKKQLIEISEWAKKTTLGGYDCTIGVSGGKDSFFQALYAKEELDLNVLLVNTAPDCITDVGRYNLENLVQQGFDMVSFRPNPKIMSKLTKESFIKYGNPVKPSEYPLFSVPYQTAIMYNTPLVIWGENIAMTLGVKHLEPSGDALGVLKHNTLEGLEEKEYWLRADIKQKELNPYYFPNTKNLKNSFKAIYLNYYVKEWGWKYNTDFSVARGLKGRINKPELTGRINPYNSVDGDIQIVNQMIKYYKLGFGFVTDEVSYYIREGLMTRSEAIELVKKYDGKCDGKYIEEFCKYIDISVKEFWKTLDNYVNKRLFNKDSQTGKWTPKFEVGINFNE